MGWRTGPHPSDRFLTDSCQHIELMALDCRQEFTVESNHRQLEKLTNDPDIKMTYEEYKEKIHRPQTLRVAEIHNHRILNSYAFLTKEGMAVVRILPASGGGGELLCRYEADTLPEAEAQFFATPLGQTALFLDWLFRDSCRSDHKTPEQLHRSVIKNRDLILDKMTDPTFWRRDQYACRLHKMAVLKTCASDEWKELCDRCLEEYSLCGYCAYDQDDYYNDGG